MCVLAFGLICGNVLLSHTKSQTKNDRRIIIMCKEILVLTGSPRKNGNSFAMTEAFIAEVKKRGHTVTRFDIAAMSVSGCRACEKCFKTGKACIFNDDFNKIAPVIQAADAIVFSMPVYWYSIPSQIKAVIDKLFSFYNAKIDLSDKECALISCCEEADTSVFDGVLIPIKRSASLLNWKMLGAVLVPSVIKAGDIDKTDGCKLAADLADKF